LRKIASQDKQKIHSALIFVKNNKILMGLLQFSPRKASNTAPLADGIFFLDFMREIGYNNHDDKIIRMVANWCIFKFESEDLLCATF
jgi:hypothetical protein